MRSELGGPAPERSARRAAKRGIRLLAAVLAACAVAGCIYDADDRCSDHQVVYQDSRCVCDPGSAWTAQGCVVCGENEQPGASGCECVAGFARAMADAECEPMPSGLGDACDTDSAPCGEGPFAYCQVVSGTSGYCTSVDCSDSAPCEGGYACETRADTPFCRRPPVGLGSPCESADDCAGTEATWCDTFQTQQCIVQGCSLADQDCFGDQVCCDLSQFNVPVPLCLPAGGC
jgi:hypothetical protein